MVDTIAAQRQEAHELNLKKFYTGKPCTRGHDAPRYTSSGGCTMCSADNNRDHYEKWGQHGVKAKSAAVRRGKDQALAFLGLPPSMTRAEAIVAGVKTYYTGKPCRSCDAMAARYTSTGGCVPCRSMISKEHNARTEALKNV